MKVSMEEKKAEAIKRMKKMRIWSQAIKCFDKQGKIFVTEPPMGAVYDPEPELKKTIEEFEKEHNALVYMIVRAFTSFGKMDSLLYVSDYAEEWEMDNDDINYGVVMSYTINYDMPDCSEFGSIGVRPTIAGGLMRVS